MPKTIPIITDWPEAERLALVLRLHPRAKSVTREPNLDRSLGNNQDDQAWYMVVLPTDDGRGENQYPYRLRVETCQHYLDHIGAPA